MELMDYKSIMGYAHNSPFRNAPYLDIATPEGSITMENTPIDLLGVDNYGNVKKMKANSKNPYMFKGNVVREIPIKNNPYQQGGITQDMFDYLFGEEEDEDIEPVMPQEPADNEELSLDKNLRILAQREQDDLAMEQANMPFDNPYRRENYFEFDDEFADDTFSSQLSLTPDTYLQAIFGNEAGQTGVDPSNVKGTASGRFGIIKSGRQDLYRKYYSNIMPYSEFENKYNTDPNFEYGVARLLAQENIKNSKSTQEALGRWYSPAHASSGQWDVVPRADYGNKLTVRQYVNKAIKNIK